MSSNKKKFNPAFTIAELIIVIVVIAILAGVAIIGYGSWKNSISATAVKSDLKAAGVAMESARNHGDSGYPLAIPTTFIESTGVTVNYVAGNASAYCIEGTHDDNDAAHFYLSSVSAQGEPETEDCSSVIYDDGVDEGGGGGGGTGTNTIFVFDTTKTNCATTVKLPVSAPAGSAGSTISWGDGNSEPFTTANQSHTYASEGVYTVTYNGPISAINTSSFTIGFRGCLTKLTQWGSLALPTSVRFENSNSIDQVATPPTSITSMAGMFKFAYVFNQSINHWNVSNVTDMSGMFWGASAFNQPLSTWNTANVTTMSNMFDAATVFNQPIGVWNTANVTSMTSMFRDARAFNQAIGAWNTAKVTSLDSTFSGASAFNQPLNTWNTANVTGLSNTFYWATAFNQPLSNWNTAKVNIMYQTFHHASAFNQPIGTWNTGNVVSMTRMFREAAAFNQPIGTWNTVKVVQMDFMFFSATSFNQNLSAWNTSAVTTHTSFDMGATAWTLPRPSF